MSTSTKNTVTVAQLLSWSLPAHVDAAKRGDPDARKALYTTMASLVEKGEAPTESSRMLRQLAEANNATDVAEATYTKKPPNSPPRIYRDARIVAEVRVLILFRDWVKAVHEKPLAFGPQVPDTPITMDEIFSAVANMFGLKPPRVEAIWKRRGKK
jgi:hypothetical protein